MPESTLPPPNRIFPGLPPGAWEGFVAGCTYRWKSGPDMPYPARYQWKGSAFYVPYRVGYTEGEGCTVRTEADQIMAWCLKSRHHDGVVRQSALRQLLNGPHHPCAAPYLLRPLSEYVFGIYNLLDSHRDQLPRGAMRELLAHNPSFSDLTWHRMRSYWNAYYRRQVPRFSDMPNARVMAWLENTG